MATDPEIQKAIWEGDVNKLDQLAGCICCCDEHTFEGCPARQWEGCRGQGTMTRDDVEAWADFYDRHHGMTRAKFYGYKPYGEELTDDEQVAVDLLSGDLVDADDDDGISAREKLSALVPNPSRRAHLAMLVRIGP